MLSLYASHSYVVLNGNPQSLCTHWNVGPVNNVGSINSKSWVFLDDSGVVCRLHDTERKT
jgi:hypothetical protein